MAAIRSKDIKTLEKKDFDKRLKDLRMELAKERANIAIGASVTSPGKLKELKRAIARMESEATNRLKESLYKNKTEGVKR